MKNAPVFDSFASLGVVLGVCGRYQGYRSSGHDCFSDLLEERDPPSS